MCSFNGNVVVVFFVVTIVYCTPRAESTTKTPESASFNFARCSIAGDNTNRERGKNEDCPPDERRKSITLIEELSSRPINGVNQPKQLVLS